MKADFEVPTRGWNDRDNMDSMEAGYALEMADVVPENGYLRMRGGSYTYQNESVANSGFDAEGAVETLEAYNANGTEVLVAVRGGSVYTIDDTTTATELDSGYSNSRFQTMMFNGYLVMVNGEDTPLQYDGSSLSAITMTLKDSLGVTIVGLTKSDLIGCMSFKGRGIYWADDEQRFFYADTAGGYAGDLIEFPISMIASKGGKIVSIMNYARDTGSGLDDFLAIHMSTGECIVYQGTDPETDFEIVQTYQIGAPISIRGNTQYGGDQVIATTDGFINLTTALPNQKFSKAGNIGDVIVNAAKTAAKRWGSNYGWEAEFFPEFGWLIFNIPRGANRVEQYVMNTVTNAWFKCRELDAVTWCVFEGRLMYGDVNGNIMEAESGTYDEREGEKNPIVFKVITAFSKMGSMGTAKTVNGVSMTHNYPYGEYLDIDILTDYDRRTSYPLLTPPETIAAVWNAGQWNKEAWNSVTDPLEGATRRDNYAAGDSGISIALKIRGMSKTQTIYIYDLSLQFKNGGRI